MELIDVASIVSPPLFIALVIFFVVRARRKARRIRELKGGKIEDGQKDQRGIEEGDGRTGNGRGIGKGNEGERKTEETRASGFYNSPYFSH